MSLFKNFLSLAGAEALSKIVTVVTFAYLARVAGPDGFGNLEFAGAILMCASLLVDQGFSSYGAREVAKAPLQTPRFVSEILAARFLLAVGASLAVVLIAIYLERANTLTRLLLIYAASIWITPLLLHWVFQGHDRMHLAAVVQLIRQVVFAVVVFMLVRSALGIWMVGLAEVAAVSAAAIYCLLVYRKHFSALGRIRLRLSVSLFREGLPIGLSQTFWIVKAFGATVIVGFIATPEDVGYFAGAMRILIAMYAFTWLYFINLLPSMSRSWIDDRQQFSALIERSLVIVAWGAAICVAAIIPLSSQIMGVVYGKAFLTAGHALMWLIGAFVVGHFSGHYRFGLIAAGKQTQEMTTSALGSLATVVALPFGYHKLGPVGPAVAVFLGEVVVWLFAWRLSVTSLGLSGHSRVLLRATAGALFGLGVWELLPIESVLGRSLVAAIGVMAFGIAIDARWREEVVGFFGSHRQLQKAIGERVKFEAP